MAAQHKKQGTNRKKKNPLYVVKNDGKDIEEARGLIDALIKRLNLEPIIEFLNFYLKIALESINSYALFVAFKEWFDAILEKVNKSLDRFSHLMVF